VTHDELSAALEGIREAGDADDSALADATRARLVRSLETRVRRHKQYVSLATILVLMLGGTVSWAWTTGRLQALLGTSPAPVESPAPAPAPAPAPTPKVRAASAPTMPDVTFLHEDVAIAATDPLPPADLDPEPSAQPAPAPKAEPPPIEVLYRRAHELHFHGRDPNAAIAAWDAYLAAEPTGRFAIEGAFNRGLLLARVGRYREALAALAPFARGEVQPTDYRRAEAQELVERLEQLVRNRE
jgi:hypothetical protein